MKKVCAVLTIALLLIMGISILTWDISMVKGEEIRTGGPGYWEMDSDISLASLATFIGEDSEDRSGNSVSGAGDVNGDGYDDILIGAYFDEDGGGIRAGQTYLILGNASGMALDTDLSIADASFIGENRGDYSGQSVSGAGDVNGDGYDDILIGAFGDDDGGDRAGQTYLILGNASGWAMDTSLSNANASFIGEHAVDRSGYSVSGAGDVNGDGYDDILIGADFNDAGGDLAGQTYLILGKASGWAMDIYLSNADASFIGESAPDQSGISISGAGDVNGDGYDDLLIGAWGNGDGGADAGQTYLILGKASGWAMETDLSNADASFIGEDAGDLSGQSVSGAGDVNGDGYDDILIGAFGDDDGGTRAGQTYLILGKASGWAMDTDLSNADASFWGENAEDRSGNSVSGAGDVNGDGYDDISIGAFRNGDGGSDAGQTYLIMGADNTIFGKDNTPGTAANGEELTFSINITERPSIISIFVEYWYGSGDHTNISMTNVNDNTWNHSIVVASDTLDILYYKFSTPIGLLKWRNISVRNITIFDNDHPVFGADLTDQSAYTGDPFTLSIEVTDNIYLENVNIEYWFGSGEHLHVDAIKGSLDKWKSTITIPSNTIESLHYIFKACDSSNNINYSQERSIPVFDNDQPEFVIDNTPYEGTTGDEYTFSVEVIDNIEVSDVYVEYWYGTGSIINSSLEKGDENQWHLGINMPDTMETFYYVFHSKDTSDNWNSLQMISVEVTDNDLPEFGEDTSGTSATTGGDFTFEIEIADNIELLRTYVTYWDDEGELLKSGLMGEGPFSSTVTIPIHWTTFQYSFHAVDIAENQKETENKTINVMDDILPSILEDLTPDTCETGEDIAFTVNATDNIGLSGVDIEYWYGDNEHEVLHLEYDMDHYVGFITIPVDSIESLYYEIKASDTSENWNGTDPVEVTITDCISPTLEPIPDVTIYLGGEINITLVAEDNIGITSYSWWGSPIDADGASLVGIMEEVGTFSINVLVEDEEGNTNNVIFNLTVLSTDHDEDNDGIPDLIEIFYGLDPDDDTDAVGDLDSDDLTNWEEFLLGTDLNMSDTDGDGLLDGYEVSKGYDPLDPTTKESTADPDKESSSSSWIWIAIILIVILIGIAVGSVIFLKKRKGTTSEEGFDQEPKDKEGSETSQIPTRPSLMPSTLMIKPQLPISSAPAPSRQQTLPAASQPVSAVQMPQATEPAQAPSQPPETPPTSETQSTPETEPVPETQSTPETEPVPETETISPAHEPSIQAGSEDTNK